MTGGLDVKRFNAATVVVLAAVVCFLVPAIASAEPFVAKLSGAQEVPAVSTSAAGQFLFNFTTVTPTVSTQNRYSLTYLRLVGNVTQSHIHIGQPGVNGGISIWLCQTAAAPAPAAVAATTPTCSGTTAGGASGQITADKVLGPTGQLIAAGDFASVIRALRAGLGYVNVHTSAVGSGEIRGEIR
jgi:hypothetical protein